MVGFFFTNSECLLINHALCSRRSRGYKDDDGNLSLENIYRPFLSKYTSHLTPYGPATARRIVVIVVP